MTLREDTHKKKVLPAYCHLHIVISMVTLKHGVVYGGDHEKVCSVLTHYLSVFTQSAERTFFRKPAVPGTSPAARACLSYAPCYKFSSVS